MVSAVCGSVKDFGQFLKNIGFTLILDSSIPKHFNIVPLSVIIPAVILVYGEGNGKGYSLS